MRKMLAVFDDSTERDNAVSNAKNENMRIQYVGDIKPVIEGTPTDSLRPFVIFETDDAAAIIFFMRHGAGSCSDV
jgi:hypothetical protein